MKMNALFSLSLSPGHAFYFWAGRANSGTVYHEWRELMLQSCMCDICIFLHLRSTLLQPGSFDSFTTSVSNLNLLVSCFLVFFSLSFPAYLIALSEECKKPHKLSETGQTLLCYTGIFGVSPPPPSFTFLPFFFLPVTSPHNFCCKVFISVVCVTLRKHLQFVFCYASLI